MVSDGTARPYRVKIKSPDYASLQAIDTLGRGHRRCCGHYRKFRCCFGSIDR
jgi:NADH:ubiquinone oxidoreductase subunit D